MLGLKEPFTRGLSPSTLALSETAIRGIEDNSRTEESIKDQGSSTTDITKLYRQIESKLEAIADRLLRSKMHDNDNILQNVQFIIERIFIAEAMKIAQSNISQASKLLGINRNTLSKKLKEIERIP
jgi:DNA-binding protein Fis